MQNNERKFYQQLGGDEMKTYQPPDVKETKQFGQKYGNQKHNEKPEWIKNMTIEQEGLEESLKVEMHIDLLKKTLNKFKLENARP